MNSLDSDGFTLCNYYNYCKPTHTIVNFNNHIVGDSDPRVQYRFAGSRSGSELYCLFLGPVAGSKLGWAGKYKKLSLQSRL